MAQAQPVFSDAFSQVVKRHREKRALSRSALAEKSGLHQTYVGLLERGERSPNLDTAKAIADALGRAAGQTHHRSRTDVQTPALNFSIAG